MSRGIREPDENLQRIADAFASISASHARMAKCSEEQLKISREQLATSKAAVEATKALEAQLKRGKDGS